MATSTCLSRQCLGTRAMAPPASRAGRRHAVIVRAEQLPRIIEEPKNALKEAKDAVNEAQRAYVPERTYAKGLPENWNQAVPNGGESPTTISKEYGAGEAMSFSGPAPEIINGRLAMLGFVAAVVSEIATGRDTATQFWQAPTPTIAVVVLFAIASLIPMIRGVNMKVENGIWTKKAELWNGRLAMIGFPGLLIAEAFRGGVALFH